MHVALSGGLDSSVLLHLLHALRSLRLLQGTLHALHVNHNLQADAGIWEQHCRQSCARLDIPIRCITVEVVADGASPEEAARKARHAEFANLLQPGEVLVLAHHRDDQVETVLFRLLRGSGTAGLAGMPQSRACGKGLLLRPLLDMPRSSLRAHAETAGLEWIEDPSNRDTRYERNFLRNSILPALQERWPGLAGAVTRSAALCAESAVLQTELATLDLQVAGSADATRLPCTHLRRLSAPRLRNLLYHWLQALHANHGFAAPTHQLIQQIINEVLAAAPDATPVLCWGTGAQAGEVHRHRDTLYMLRPLPPLPESIQWHTATPLPLPAGLGTLALEPSPEPGLARDLAETLEIRFRSGGETLKSAGRPTRPLKKLLQESGVPPWLRSRIPLLYSAGKLVALADLLVCEDALDKTGQNACRIVWQRPDADCG